MTSRNLNSNMNWHRLHRHIFQKGVLLMFCILLLTLLCWIMLTYQGSVLYGLKFILKSNYRECTYRRWQNEAERKSTQTYVTVVQHGRMGNWMFSYASLLGIARANGYIPYLTQVHPLTLIFNLKSIQPNDAECLHNVSDNLPLTYNSDFMNLPPGNISIDGYIQSWRYFRFMEKEIRDEFKLRDSIRTKAVFNFRNHVGEYLVDGRPIISIHVRRGDLLLPETRKLGFCHAPKSYLDAAMKYMIERYPNAVFLVISDDIMWCKKNILPPKMNYSFASGKLLQNSNVGMTQLSFQDKVPIIFSKLQDSVSDFALLTLCNHSILTLGTFGWWGAWLANGHVVYYKDFSLPGTKLDHELKRKDHFPEHWVALSDGSGIVLSIVYMNCILSVCFFLFPNFFWLC